LPLLQAGPVGYPGTAQVNSQLEEGIDVACATSTRRKGDMALSQEQVATYQREGLLKLPGFFDAEELEPLRRAYREDPTVNGAVYGMVDLKGEPHPICIWTELADDILGMIPRMARMVEATEALLGEACYHWHSKLSIKPPRCRALVDWHQDYASWYDDGVLFPSMLTVAVALEPATRENGCTQFIPGSHHLGRIDHRAGADGYNSFGPRQKRAAEVLGVTHCELDVGDAVFFHCNLLHGSGSNETDTPRPMLFASYNAASNAPVAEAHGANEEGAFMNIPASEREFKALNKLPDDVLLTKQYKSAFHHTPFKQPRLGLSGTFSPAVEIDSAR